MELKSALVIITDVIVLIAVGLPALLISQLVTPYQRGLFCNDNSIRYPHQEDTISETVVIICGYVLPLIVIFIVEILRYKMGVDKILHNAHNMHPLFIICYHNVIAFLFGAFCTTFVTTVGKVTIGRLRPHFWDVCSPINIDCQQYSSYEYHTDFNCGKDDQNLIENARLSFPSGHSSSAWYCMVYFSIYIWKRVPRSWSPLLRPMCQFLLILAAFYCSLSRVMDNAHHPGDVIAGGIIGTVFAILTAFVLTDLIRHQASPEQSALVDSTNTS